MKEHAGRDDYYGWSLPDAVAALAMADATTACALPLAVSISGPTQIQPEAICAWEAVVEPRSGNYTYDWYNDGIRCTFAPSERGQDADLHVSPAVTGTRGTRLASPAATLLVLHRPELMCV